MVSKFAICGGKKSRFVKKQEARGVLSSLGLKTPLNKIPLLDFFFSVYKNEWNSQQIFISWR